MNMWSAEITAGEFFLDFSWLALLLVAGALLRFRVSFFREYLLPANLIAGVIGLMIGANGLGIIDITSGRLGIYVYHLLALLFIALGLRTPQSQLGLSSIKVGIMFIMAYLVQAMAGLIIAFLLIYTIDPNLFAGIGMLPPLAFGMNPGIAFTIGGGWESYGFESGGIVGLTFSAIGFLVAYTFGIWIVRRGIKQGRAELIDNDEIKNQSAYSGIADESNPIPAGKVTTAPEAIESFTLHFGLIGLIYIFTYLVLTMFTHVLIWIGIENEISTLWSFHFIFAAILSLLARKCLDFTSVSNLIDDVTMTRCSNLFMDFMIVASVAAISFVVVAQYWLPLVAISSLALFATWYLIDKMSKQGFEDFVLERFSAVFGNMTGTLQSGLILLRILDPGMKSPVSFNLVYGSGLALVLGFPLLILLNAPVHYFDNVNTGFGMVFIVLLGYFVLLQIAWQYLRPAK